MPTSDNSRTHPADEGGMVMVFRRDNTDEWEERQDRSKQPAPDRHVCDSHCAHYCPAPAQPVSAEAWSLEQTLINVCQLLDGWHQDGTAWSTWDEEVRRNVSSHLAIQKSAAQQNAALREELERAKKDLADSRLNHIDANQRNIRAIARAEAAEAELAEARKEIQDAKTYMIDVGGDKQHHWHGTLKTWVHEFGKLAKRKLPSAEELADRLYNMPTFQHLSTRPIALAMACLAALQEGE